MTQWLPVVNRSRYLISDEGEVFSTFSNKTLIPNLFDGKYLSVTLGRTNCLVHLLVLEAFVGPRPEGMETLHTNDVGSDNRLSNLRWGTRSENMRDSVRNGTHCQTRKTHCVHGHEFTPENTMVGRTRRGEYRRCKACKNDDQRRRRTA